MVCKASRKTHDMLVLNEMDLTVLIEESIRSCHQRMRLSRPSHIWEALEDLRKVKIYTLDGIVGNMLYDHRGFLLIDKPDYIRDELLQIRKLKEKA